MKHDTIIVDIDAPLATLTLNRPEHLNAISAQMHIDIGAALDVIETDDNIRGLLITGAGRGFCAGQDLSERSVSAAGPVDLGASLETLYNPLILRLTGLSMPVVCAVNGVAAGAGVSLALAADIVIAAHNARFVQSFANIGLVPDSGASYHLPRLIGQARALGMSLTGEPISAQTAQDWGLIWKSVADDALLPSARTTALSLAHGATAGLAATKHAIRAAWQADLPAQLDHERDTQRRLGNTHDYREGVDAFLNKRAAAFTGH